mmetsp:Transcript_1956/g.2933  ORF Transcript_1956/g.2933 Transcript_1956/m.2933 type:complete len:95 (-) Transcript_1956:1278-1562(-)
MHREERNNGCSQALSCRRRELSQKNRMLLIWNRQDVILSSSVICIISLFEQLTRTDDDSACIVKNSFIVSNTLHGNYPFLPTTKVIFLFLMVAK